MWQKVLCQQHVIPSCQHCTITCIYLGQGCDTFAVFDLILLSCIYNMMHHNVSSTHRINRNTENRAHRIFWGSSNACLVDLTVLLTRDTNFYCCIVLPLNLFTILSFWKWKTGWVDALQVILDQMRLFPLLGYFIMLLQLHDIYN